MVLFTVRFRCRIWWSSVTENIVPDKVGYLEPALPRSLYPRFLIDQLQPYVRLLAYVTSHEWVFGITLFHLPPGLGHDTDHSLFFSYLLSVIYTFILPQFHLNSTSLSDVQWWIIACADSL